jgi:hypothetical protein
MAAGYDGAIILALQDNVATTRAKRRRNVICKQIDSRKNLLLQLEVGTIMFAH